ncbi:putative phage protein gp47/JayE [Agrobacterium vitis]|nr:putative phage protein gp47/JayE [Agrobacterium vitis]
MLTIPSLSELAEQMRQKFRTYLPGSDAWVWPNNVGVTAKVLAGGLYALYAKLEYVERQAFVVTAEGEYLQRHGSAVGVNIRAASQARGKVVVTVDGAASLAAGAILQRSDGVQFSVLSADALLAAGNMTVPVQALLGGATGTTLAGTGLTIVSGLTFVSGSGVATAAVDAAGLSGGSDVEDVETFRARILFRKRHPYSGGAAADYVSWAMNVPGVTRVYVERLWAGPGTVRVFPVTDGLTPGGIPSAATLKAVENAIALEAPAGAAVTVAAPTPKTINLTITDLQPSTTAVQEAVKSALAQGLIDHGAIAGSDTPVAGMDFLATPRSFSRSWLWQAVANASGSQRHVLTVPTADVPLAVGEMPVLGTVNFA